MNERFEEVRARIVENDRRIVEAVNERLRLVGELWALKADLALPLQDNDRERRLRELLAESNAGPLTREGLDDLVTELLALTKRELGSA
jgi:chorismate mutase